MKEAFELGVAFDTERGFFMGYFFAVLVMATVCLIFSLRTRKRS